MSKAQLEVIAALRIEVDDLKAQLEDMRTRAEATERRIAEVSGVTREQLAAREYERGKVAGKAQLDEVAQALREAIGWVEWDRDVEPYEKWHARVSCYSAVLEKAGAL